MLHLQDQVIQFALYGQRPLWRDVQALFWVKNKKSFVFWLWLIQCAQGALLQQLLCLNLHVPRLVLLRLSEERVGDICNACVLLVKRWKKLPTGSKKNWNHVSDVPVQLGFHHHVGLWIDICSALNQVVDARAGPGFKVTKPKKIKNSDGKKKSKLKRLHKLKRQGWLFNKAAFQILTCGKYSEMPSMTAF